MDGGLANKCTLMSYSAKFASSLYGPFRYEYEICSCPAHLEQGSDINTETQQEVRRPSVTGSATSSLRMREVLLGGQ